MTRAWGIKLGPGGAAVQFCEEHHLVGVGWRTIDTQILQSGTRDELTAHVRATCDWYETAHQRGRATGALWRFARECTIGDYIVYYDPAGKRVRICRVASDVERCNDAGGKPDIWHTRRVEYPIEAIPIPDLHAAIRGSLLSPRGTFWEIRAVDVVQKLANGVPAAQVGVTDDALSAAYQALSDQVCQRLQLLNPHDWELLVADYFEAQGATIEGRIGGNQAVIDFEAYFGRGALGGERWRVQVKRLQNQKVDWAAVEKDVTDAGKQTNHRFCFVSAFGFTADAHAQAAFQRVQLLEAPARCPLRLAPPFLDVPPQTRQEEAVVDAPAPAPARPVGGTVPLGQSPAQPAGALSPAHDARPRPCARRAGGSAAADWKRGPVLARRGHRARHRESAAGAKGAKDVPEQRGARPGIGLGDESREGGERKAGHEAWVGPSPSAGARGLRYRLDASTLAGRPDIVVAKHRLVVFCDGDFWHGRNLEARLAELAGAHNAAYWVKKISSTVAGDRAHDASLRAAGWRVLRLWEGEFLRDIEGAAMRVVEATKAGGET